MSSNEPLQSLVAKQPNNLIPAGEIKALRIAALDVEPQSRNSETVAANAKLPTPPLIQRAFDTFLSLEPDADWQIDVEKLHAFLSQYHNHRTVSLSETRSIMELADLDQNGRLSFSEFHSIFACLSIVRDLFGVRSVKELKPIHVKQALLHAGLEPRGAQIESMFQLGDQYKARETVGESSELDFVELLRIFLHTPRSTPGHVFLHSWYSAGRNSTPYNMPAQDVSPSQDFIAGTMAGVALTLVGHPFDTVKVRLQTQSSFKSGWQCVTETLKNENVLSFFKGMGGPMMTIPLTNAIVFGAYSQGKSLIHKLRGDEQGHKPLSMWQVGLAGAYAGLLSCAVACPVELVKTRLQIQYTMSDKEPFKGPLDCVRAIYKRRGIKGLFRGMSATIYREVPGYGGQFFTYEALKQTFAKRDGKKLDQLGPLPLILSGGTAGICGWCLSYPMDFVKSQIQAEPYQTKTPWRKHPILLDGGFFDCFRYTVRQHGFRSLWRGFGPCVARAFPANAAGFVAYEWTMKALRNIDTEEAAI